MLDGLEKNEHNQPTQRQSGVDARFGEPVDLARDLKQHKIAPCPARHWWKPRSDVHFRARLCKRTRPRWRWGAGWAPGRRDAHRKTSSLPQPLSRPARRCQSRPPHPSLPKSHSSCATLWGWEAAGFGRHTYDTSDKQPENSRGTLPTARRSPWTARNCESRGFGAQASRGVGDRAAGQPCHKASRTERGSRTWRWPPTTWGWSAWSLLKRLRLTHVRRDYRGRTLRIVEGKQRLSVRVEGRAVELHVLHLVAVARQEQEHKQALTGQAECSLPLLFAVAVAPLENAGERRCRKRAFNQQTLSRHAQQTCQSQDETATLVVVLWFQMLHVLVVIYEISQQNTDQQRSVNGAVVCKGVLRWTEF